MWKSYDPETRKEKASKQSLFLIETIPSSNELEKQFIVMGSSGNVYIVTVRSKPKCTCPDYLTRRRNCKHIFFILIKVMQVEDEDQDQFGDTQLKEMFSKIPKITANLIVNRELRQLYKIQNGDGSEEDHYEAEMESDKEIAVIDDETKVSRRPIDDKCPICLEDLKEDETLDFCKYGCGKAIHYKCFTMYSKYNKEEKCVFCRAEWIKKEDKKKEKSLAKRSNSVSNLYKGQKWGYMNLLEIQSDSQITQSNRNNIRVNSINITSNEGENDDSDFNEEEQRGSRKIGFKKKREDNLSLARKRNSKYLDDVLITRPKTAYTFYEEEKLKKNRSKSIIRNRSQFRENWKNIGKAEKKKFEKMALEDKDRYIREKNGNFIDKNKDNKKRGRQMEKEKKAKKVIISVDKKSKTQRGRKISEDEN